MKQFCEQCLDAAVVAGASYVDVRVTDTLTQALSVRNGVVEGISGGSSFGFGVRVVADGAWGFAASSEVTAESAARIARQAVAIARASATVGARPIALSPLQAHTGTWTGPCVVDPFSVSTDDKLRVLFDADEAMRAQEGIALTTGSMS
ncbi:MAG TPA: DNA gyrase modulator, partial [Cellulomonas sp.]